MFPLLTVFLSCDSPADEAPLSPTPGAVTTDIDPAVAKLLELKAEANALPDFVSRLEDLANQQGWQQQFAKCKKLSFSDWEDARAVTIRCENNQFVVVLLKSWTHSIPGSDMQTAILLDKRGKCLDYLACEINSRLTHMSWGQLHTVVPVKPEANGAQVIIRLDGESARGNFAHQIHHRGETADFYWGHADLPQNQPTKCGIASNPGHANSPKTLPAASSSTGTRPLLSRSVH
jgi:hypothetical protein